MVGDFAMASGQVLGLIPVLQTLLEQEQASLFRCIEEESCYVPPAMADLVRPLKEMAAGNRQRILALGESIEQRGGTVKSAPDGRERQYLAFLSLQHLLPALVRAKQASIATCQAAISAIGTADNQSGELLRAHLREHQRDLEMLTRPHGQDAAKA